MLFYVELSFSYLVNKQKKIVLLVSYDLYYVIFLYLHQISVMHSKYTNGYFKAILSSKESE